MLGCLQQMSGFSGCSLKERGNLRTSEILGALYLYYQSVMAFGTR